MRASVLSFLLLLAVGSSSLRSQAADPSRKEREPDPVHGSLSKLPVSLFRTHCLKCHDADGRGEIARDTLRSIPDFTNARWQDSQSDGQLSHAILEGQGKSMPMMKRKLSRAEVGRLVVLVRAFREGGLVVPDEEEVSGSSTKADVPPAPAPVARTEPLPAPNVREAASRSGGAIFQRSCLGCHGQDGRGDAVRALMPEVPDFTSRAWHERRNSAELMASILEGKGSHMPAFRDKLRAEQVRAIVGFIRGFGPNPAAWEERTASEFEAHFTRLSQEFESLRQEFQAVLGRPVQGEARRETPGLRND